MGCKYIYGGIEYSSYDDLIGAIQSMDIGTIQDLLFSEGSRADMVHDQLEELKIASIEMAQESSSMLDGGSDIDKSNTISKFLDSADFKINGESPIFQIDMEEYINHMKERFMADGVMTQEEADLWGGLIREHWDTIAKDSAQLHKLMVGPINGKVFDITYADWAESDDGVKGTAFSALADKMSKARKDIDHIINKRAGGKRLSQDHVIRVVRNINFSSELHIGDGSEEVFGHIDYAVVTDNGDVEIYNIKTSTQQYENWPRAKMEKYRYEMAMIKRALMSRGISAQHIRVNIIPVQIKYDGSMNNVTDVIVNNGHVPLDMNDAMYTFQQYDKVATKFFSAPLVFANEPGEALETVPAQLQHIFPGKDVMVQGIMMTAAEWVDLNWKNCNPQELPNGGYKLTLPDTGETVEVRDPRTKSKNIQFVQWVENNIDLENETASGTISAYVLKEDLRQARNVGGFFSSSKSGRGRYLNQMFSKYFMDREEDPKTHEYKYTWRIVDSVLLDSANIIAFQNMKTGQLDVFTLSPVNPDTIYEFSKGNQNLLGGYLNELNSDNFTLKSTYANIEMVRTMAILNAVVPKLSGEVVLGNLTVIGLGTFQNKMGAYYECRDTLKIWDDVVRIVNRETQGRAGLTNDLREKNIRAVRPIEVLSQTWEDIANNSEGWDLQSLDMVKDTLEGHSDKNGIYVDGLSDNQSVEAIISKLESLISRLSKLMWDRGFHFNSQKDIIQAARNDGNLERRAMARIYIAASKALLAYSGETIIDDEVLTSLEELAITPTSMANNSARRVGFLVQKTIDMIRNKIISWYNDKPKQIFSDYYKACGYTSLRNMTIGDQAKVYRNLFQTDENGVNTFLFKNPYDPDSDLKEHERVFLKNILYEFYKVRLAMHPGSLKEITGPDDKTLYKKLPQGYLFVPLQKAASATRGLRLRERAIQFGKDFHRIFTDPQGYAEELRGYLNRGMVEGRDMAIDQMRTYNRYTRSELNMESRNSIISERGVQYFETNVENIFIDFMSQQVQCEENNKLLMKLRGIELALTFKGLSETSDSDDIKEIDKVVKYIDDYINLNIYNKSIMEPSAQKIDNFLQPFRRLVSEFYIAANPAAFFRDIMQGLEENFLMAAIKYQTDVNVSDVAFAYSHVIGDAFFNNMMNMSKINQFNVKYGFSNFDAARVSERLKSGRGGVLNVDNWRYATLRAPDYLNRMVLFVAKLKHDGIYDAYSLDENGRLVYDWKKDKRFSAYAAGDTADPKYKEQRALYRSLIRMFNAEDSSLQLGYNDPLPDAYTAEQIRTIKTLSESIYGAYDKSARAKAESTAIGRNFLFFITWMNGLVNTYWKRPQVSHSEMTLEQETDYNGNKLFFDENGNITTEDTGEPVVKNVPIMVQGVLNTFGQVLGEVVKGPWGELPTRWKNNIWSNPINRRNIRRALTDLLVMMIFTILFKTTVKPAYQKHKKEDDGSQFVTNALVEMIYKGGRASFDTFKGPVAVIEYLGESTNPASYTLQMKLLKDGYNFLTGKKRGMEVLMNTQALLRSMQDSYKMWAREQKNDEIVEATHPSQK